MTTTARRLDRARRRFLRHAATATLGPLLLTERTIAQTRTLYVNSWGGSFTAAQEAAYFKPFTALTGIPVRVITPVSYARVKAQVQTGSYQFDMTSVNSMLWLRASREGLAEPTDFVKELQTFGEAETLKIMRTNALDLLGDRAS